MKAVRELGLPKLWFFGLYQIGLHTGLYRHLTPARLDSPSIRPALHLFQKTPQIPKNHQQKAIEEADAVCQGQYRLFAVDFAHLDLATGAGSQHWTELEKRPPEIDIKYIWEPGRFGWAISLARAYAFSGDPTYAINFWQKTLLFLSLHPPNQGRQWQSAQEVAIRLMVLVFCDQIFADAPESTPENRQQLWQAIAQHAQRIPSTLVYARAQNNNHLISEAAGLYIAGQYMTDHPQAEKWRRTGWRWLNWAYQNQINVFGAYTQHSVNYHRVMLQLGLFADYVRRLNSGPDWPEATRIKLGEATRWLWALTDPKTGQTPNLGANDGAYLFPLTSLAYQDFRPVVDAAAKAFLGHAIYDSEELTEMAQWFELTAPPLPDAIQPQAADMLRIDGANGRAFIHAARYNDRPSHADQLHVDLWWHSVNVARDPGTFQYSAMPPWENALMTTRVHNTLTLDGKDQMTKAGRFLWLDWAQAEVLAHEVDEHGRLRCITAEHNGYRKSGVLHQRTLSKTPDGWQVTDLLQPFDNKTDDLYHNTCLTWQLPDWQWHLSAAHTLQLIGPNFSFSIEIKSAENIYLFRSGHCILGEKPITAPNWGWVSLTYGNISPSLMLIATQQGKMPLRFKSIWRFDLS